MSVGDHDSGARITFGKTSLESSSPEVILENDSYLVDPKVFSGQKQTDGHLCNYLTTIAQVQLCRNDSYLEDIKNFGGLKGAAEALRKEVGTPELNNFQARDVVSERIPDSVEKITLMSLWEPADDLSVGEGVVKMIEQDFLPSVILEGERHAVLPIGVSENRQELIVWDALTGKGDSRLRRVPVDTTMSFNASAKINPVFKPAKTTK